MQRNSSTSSPSETPERQVAPQRSIHALLVKVLLNAGFLVLALAAFAGYEHFKLAGQSTPATVSLAAAAVLGLMPLRAILDELLDVESKVMHLVHGLGGLAVVGVASTGVISGGSTLSHGAMAPFAIMGAAQALMHPDRPRSSEQAEALRSFVTSLPEMRQFSAKGDLASPANARRAIAVLADLLAKAQRLGETELRADPGFNGALQHATTKMGLTLSLDAIDSTLGLLTGNPAAATALPELRRQLAEARLTVAGAAPSGRHPKSPGRHRVAPTGREPTG